METQQCHIDKVAKKTNIKPGKLFMFGSMRDKSATVCLCLWNFRANCSSVVHFGYLKAADGSSEVHELEINDVFVVDDAS